MFQITQENKPVTYSETLTWVKKHPNGGYANTTYRKAEGFKAFIPVAVQNEETGEVTQTLQEAVFALEEGGLYGVEPVAQLFGVNGPMLTQTNQEVIDILTGVKE